MIPQQQYQEQQQQQYNSQQQGYIQQSLQDNFKFYFDSTMLLESFKHILKGEEETEEIVNIDGQDVAIKVWKIRLDEEGKPLPPPMNNTGYNYTIRTLTPLMDKSISGSNIDDEKASDIALQVINTISENYYLNYTPKNNYGFTDASQIETLLDGLFTLIYTHLKKAVNMEALNKLISQVSIIENRLLEKTNKPTAPQPQLSF